jgi:hypothetical protein
MDNSTIFMDDWIKVTLCRDGDKIYHYTTAEGLKGIIENKEFWVTKSDFLNDRLEFQYATEIVTEMCKLYIKNSQMYSIFINYVTDEIHRLSDDKNCLLNGYYVISFSKKQDSALLWSEYSDFMGYCMEFDFEKLLLGIEKTESIFWHGAVIYDKEQQIECLKETLMTLIEDFKEEGYKDLDKLFDVESNVSNDSLKILAENIAIVCSVYTMFFKKECFSGEEEYRFVFSAFHERNSELGKLKIMNFREKKQLLIPYIIVKYRDNDEPIQVESILVGPKNNSDLAIKGIEYFLRKEKVDIPVYESDIPLRY